MSAEPMPLFPLGTVFFPGARVPLHVFEERYRALVRDLLAMPTSGDRVFGVVAVREGYEVGGHGAQSLHRVGCVVQLVEADPYPDGRFDIEVVARERLRLVSVEPVTTPDRCLMGSVERLAEDADESPEATQEAEDTLATFLAYREDLSRLRGTEVLDGDLTHDPLYLSYALAATCLLTLPQRQALLETDRTRTRLSMIRTSLRSERRAMRAVPSLPATEVARTRWSPN